ncbi:MAG: NAD-dependent deacylase [Anaerolineales bacterium]|nr:NAD-dependent deacylase [Anaerolineales bacterium]
MDFPSSLLDALRRARHVAALTGAGISAESGVPTFRDAQTGLWAQYRPEELATPQAFRRDPALVWNWYEWRRSLVRQAAPNPGHLALAHLEDRVPRVSVITQNVDGLHHRAGSTRIIELHGNIARTVCFDCRRQVESWAGDSRVPPHCPACDGLLRPDVVWFGELLPRAALAAAYEAAQQCDVFFSIGTSGLVEPAASLPFEALRAGAVVVEINPQATPLSDHATYVLRGPSGVVLPALLAAL